MNDFPKGVQSTREFRVKPVTRFLVTEWHKEVYADGTSTSASGLIGEFDGEKTAAEVALAMALHTGGILVDYDAPATGVDHAIFARLPSYRDEEGNIVPTPASAFDRPAPSIQPTARADRPIDDAAPSD